MMQYLQQKESKRKHEQFKLIIKANFKQNLL